MRPRLRRVRRDRRIGHRIRTRGRGCGGRAAPRHKLVGVDGPDGRIDEMNEVPAKLVPQAAHGGETGEVFPVFGGVTARKVVQFVSHDRAEGLARQRRQRNPADDQHALALPGLVNVGRRGGAEADVFGARSVPAAGDFEDELAQFHLVFGGQFHFEEVVLAFELLAGLLIENQQVQSAQRYEKDRKDDAPRAEDDQRDEKSEHRRNRQRHQHDRHIHPQQGGHQRVVRSFRGHDVASAGWVASPHKPDAMSATSRPQESLRLAKSWRCWRRYPVLLVEQGLFFAKPRQKVVRQPTRAGRNVIDIPLRRVNQSAFAHACSPY